MFVEQPLALPGSTNDIMSVLGLNSGYTVKYILCFQEFPWALPSGTPSGTGLYLTVYPSSRPYTDTVYNFQNWYIGNDLVHYCPLS